MEALIEIVHFKLNPGPQWLLEYQRTIGKLSQSVSPLAPAYRSQFPAELPDSPDFNAHSSFSELGAFLSDPQGTGITLAFSRFLLLLFPP